MPGTVLADRKPPLQRAVWRNHRAAETNPRAIGKPMTTVHADVVDAAPHANAVSPRSLRASPRRKSAGIPSRRVRPLAAAQSMSRRATAHGVPTSARQATFARQAMFDQKLSAPKRVTAKRHGVGAHGAAASGRHCRCPTPSWTVRHANRGPTATLARRGARRAAGVTAARGASVAKTCAANVVPAHHVAKKAAAASLVPLAAGPMSTRHNGRMTTNWKVSAAICWRKSARPAAATMRDQAVPVDAGAAADVVEPPHAPMTLCVLKKSHPAKRTLKRMTPGRR